VVAIDLCPRPEQANWVNRRRAALGAWLGMRSRCVRGTSFPATIGEPADWELVERLGSERGAYFRQYGYYYPY
jgi:hypothetical protein